MDQVKVYLGVAKKHHFWILAVIIVIVSIVVWMMAASSLAALYNTNKQAIDGAKKGLEETKRSPELPNPLFTQRVDGLHDDLKKQVFAAWEKLYQRQGNLLRWPDLDVGEGNTFNIGLMLKPTEDIPDRYRAIYNETVLVDQWTQLFNQLRLRRQVVPEKDEDSDEQPAARGLGGPVNYEGVIVWDEELRQAIINRYYTSGVPSSTKVRLSQEDFWLFQSLVWIINTVNGEDATDPLKAKIKEIQELDVAQWATAAAQASAKDSGKAPSRRRSGGTSSGMAGGPMGMGGGGGGGPMGPGGGGGGGPMGPGGGGGGGPMGPGGGGGGGPMGPGGPGGNNAPTPPGGGGGNSQASAAGGETKKDADTELRDGRYLDEKGQPLAAGAPEPFAEFKQVFVFMKLTMDQRAIPELIAACANAPLPVETRQVTMRMLGDDADGMGMQVFGGQSGGVETLANDATIELSGVIYLYNPPDVAQLGMGQAGSPAQRSFGVPTKGVTVPGRGKR